MDLYVCMYVTPSPSIYLLHASMNPYVHRPLLVIETPLYVPADPKASFEINTPYPPIQYSHLFHKHQFSIPTILVTTTDKAAKQQITE